MSKTVKKPRSARPGYDPERLRRIRRMATHALIALALGVACVIAFSESRRYVEETVDRPTEAVIVFRNHPAWMTDLVARQLAHSFRPTHNSSVFDHDLLVTLAERLKASPWISEVRQVRRVYVHKPGDTIEVDCDFRAPMALVHSDSDYWFVDAHGVKLPERFSAGDIPRIMTTADGHTNIRVIEGVRLPPPARAGMVWKGDDLAAALEMVRHLYGQPFLDELVKVDVSNFAGRIDPREAQIVLRTRYGTEVRWGRSWSAMDAFVEVRPERKLDNLRKIVEEFGRIDARHQWIDIRFEKVGYPTPAPDPASQMVDRPR